MSTRIGKIARLPKQIREQLNQRLENGERGKTIVQWLNELPEVQKIITEQFAGRPIREQNLSEWRNGGYLDWLRHQDFRQQILMSVEQADDYSQDEGQTNLAERLAYLMTTQLMTQLWSLNQLTDPAKRWEKTREVARELSRIRRDDQRFLRTDLRRRKFEADYPIVVTNEKGEPIETEETAQPELVPQSSDTPAPPQSNNPLIQKSGCAPAPSTPNPSIQKSINPTPPHVSINPTPPHASTNPMVFPHLSGVIRPDTGLKIRTVGDEVTSL